MRAAVVFQSDSEGQLVPCYFAVVFVGVFDNLSDFSVPPRYSALVQRVGDRLPRWTQVNTIYEVERCCCNVD